MPRSCGCSPGGWTRSGYARWTKPQTPCGTHATAMWEAGMRELALQRRLGHASPESTRIDTRVSDQQVRDEYAAALRDRR
ncbi:putative transposase [Rhodococcus opacus RKJ300 = JCM 13270]|uniref:Putative transposase n=2 Tax=Rhodococcus opacus TaxID=37919 RepID=C1BCB9_RHOOB|nr:putative transposase [Rhodococcus opacus RKJ300 = JCM 13270]BAH55974.1 putative transposase [Rhodococcus opacus B4]